MLNWCFAKNTLDVLEENQKGGGGRILSSKKCTDMAGAHNDRYISFVYLHPPEVLEDSCAQIMTEAPASNYTFELEGIAALISGFLQCLERSLPL